MDFRAVYSTALFLEPAQQCSIHECFHGNLDPNSLVVSYCAADPRVKAQPNALSSKLQTFRRGSCGRRQSPLDLPPYRVGAWHVRLLTDTCQIPIFQHHTPGANLTDPSRLFFQSFRFWYQVCPRFQSSFYVGAPSWPILDPSWPHLGPLGTQFGIKLAPRPSNSEPTWPKDPQPRPRLEPIYPTWNQNDQERC